jgi:hypothetical protein
VLFDAGGTAEVLSSRQGKQPRHAGWAPTVEALSGVDVEPRILRLDHGLYALNVQKVDGIASEHSSILLPAMHISQPPSNHLRSAEIIAADGDSASWLGCKGGTVVIKAPPGGGLVLITTYEPRGHSGRPREIAIRRIDVPALVQTMVDDAVEMARIRAITMDILLHIEGAGDCRMSAEDWIGNRGKKLRLEAFSIRPLEILAPSDIEYKAYGPNGRETPWVSDGKICGTRGLSLPLTGFAIRLATHLRGRFEIEYQGAFFESGISGPNRDGEPCIAQIADDPLEAVKLRLFERVTRRADD